MFGCSPERGRGSVQQPLLPKAEPTSVAHHDVVEEADGEGSSSRPDLLIHRDVIVCRCRITIRAVMNEDQCCGGQFERALGHLARLTFT